MAKIFTITEGLENLGALKTGGQGSVYKGRRNGDTITAVKILPTPIFNESNDDKSFRDFTNEVEKLKKVNEIPNSNIVKILTSGLSETGNFPFIEMEYIDGPDLEELLKSRPASVFTLKVAIKVAANLANALAQCHHFGVRHGDIKSNNVKFNIQTRNYVLLDFGLAVMSDEQRRTSLRRAGAVEFMAPEQNDGHMLFQSDIYSYGVLLFELLAGRVPFPLKNNSETARNEVRLAHIEDAVPDFLALRKKALQNQWTPDLREREMLVPDWIKKLIYKCLQKKPENRFADGLELRQYITEHINDTAVSFSPIVSAAPKVVEQVIDKERPVVSNTQRPDHVVKPEEVPKIPEQTRKTEPVFISKKEQPVNQRKRPAKSTSGILLVVGLLIASVIGFLYFKNRNQSTDVVTTSNSEAPERPIKKFGVKKEVVVDNQPAKNAVVKKRVQKIEEETPEQPVTKVPDIVASPDNTNNYKNSRRYKAKSFAYFHNSPDESTRRNAFINKWNASVKPLDEQNGFYYIIYTNEQGQTSKGWMRKQDLKPVD